MKAVKITKIQWDLSDVAPEERAEIKKTLPTDKGFMAPDDFEVASRTPDLLEKKFGYGIIDFSYKEIPIIESVEELLKEFKPKGEKLKKLYKAKGKLSTFGEDCLNQLEYHVKWRLRLEEEGTEEKDMPAILDKLILSLGKIGGFEWHEGMTFEEAMEPIKKYLKGVRDSYRKRKPKDPGLEDMEEFGDDDDDAEDIENLAYEDPDDDEEEEEEDEV